MDALLGAAALGDIGQHFPDTDPAYKGISSIELLKKVGELLDGEGYVVENIDATIIAQRPKLAQYRPQMAANIADALHLDVSRVSVKATTHAPGCGQGQRQVHHGGGSWFYRNRGRDFFSGNYLIDGNSRLLL